MGISKVIKQLMIERGVAVKNLSAKLNILSQSLSNKLYLDKFTLKDVFKIADFLNCDIVLVTRDSQKTFRIG